ncbi:hypothetical protein EVAR_3178_1 [Eumeta japonica]|uniref:Uncharacterized protein n=1 Tax=Eumeta variegata TaxID=151549 RepID=A0A4C1XF08_EUMVA|nr:hypothetical protein EVAR_3178_1 [Eumeta japonica]
MIVVQCLQSLVSLTYAQRVHRGRTTIFLPSEDIECCKVLDLFAEDRLTRRRAKPNTITMRRREKKSTYCSARQVPLTKRTIGTLTAGGRRSEKSSLRCENNGDTRRLGEAAAG